MSAAIAGIVVALPAEYRTFVGAGALARIRLAGVGAGNAARAAEALVAEGARGLVSWGCAAGLDPAAAPGTLCLPRIVIEREEAFPADRGWHERVREALAQRLRATDAPLVAAAHVIATVAEKRQLGARHEAVAADMESAAIARVARAHGLPFLAVRAIVDPAGMAVPSAVAGGVDARGRVPLGPLLARVALRPREAAELVKLALCFRAALATLTAAARRMNGDLRLAA